MGAYSRFMEARSSDPQSERPQNHGEPPRAMAPEGGEHLLRGVVASVGERIQELLDGAERIAKDIRSEAEASSARYLDERRREADRLVDERLSDLTELGRSISGTVERLEREARGLLIELEDARARLTSLEARSAAGGHDASGSPSPGVVAYPGTGAQGKLPEQAMLRATQMAVAGTDRSEIERMLREDFGIADPAAAVDRMLNSEPA